MDEQTDPRFLVGQVLAGRYWLQEHLGRGAMGDVFRARHAKVPRTFAVKVLHPELVADEKTCRRFEREAELAGRLHHRNVVSVIDVGETARSRYLVMEYAEGVSLVDVIAGQPMATARVINLAKQICDGLQHAHENDLVHRDLKPENIIVERTGDDEIPRVVDFGLAILRESASSEDLDRLTTRGIVLGTPHYLAPETALGGAIDHRIDLFALGVILYEMMTGVMPFDGDGVAVAQANMRSATPAMGVRAPDVEVDPLLEALVGKLLEKKPDDRPQSAREVRSLLEMIDKDREHAAFVLGVTKPEVTPGPVPSPLRDLDPRATGNGIPLERVSSNELTNRTEAAELHDDTAASRRDNTAARQRHVITDRVRARELRTTDELLRASGGRRRELTIALAAIALLAIIAVVIMTRGDDDPGTATAQVELGEGSAPTSTLHVVALEPSPPEPVEPPPQPKIVIADAPRPPVQARTARVEPVIAAAPAPGTPPKAEEILHLYQALGRELKMIADRRDMAADDLWVRYRRVRIQDVMTSTDRRAEALAILVSIDREIAKRFRDAQ